MPVPVTFKPSRGARETYDRLGDQARVQHQQRREGRPVFERLPIVPSEGLSRLPQPSPGDLFLDLEGARFARDEGREFLFGLLTCRRLPLVVGHRRWGGEARVRGGDAGDRGGVGRGPRRCTSTTSTITSRRRSRSSSAGYVTRVEALDRLLRAERFVDLYPIARQAVRCGVESYSIKQLEQLLRLYAARPA